MNIWIEIAAGAVCAAIWVVLLLYWQKMYQQNSYKFDRYWRWFKGNIFPRLFRKSKLPFKMTPRMVRLFVGATILAVAATAGAGLAGISPFWGAGASILLSNFLMILAAFILQPVEWAISKWYYNSARKELRRHDDLKIIGITGSFGKTSTKHFLHRILSEQYNVLMTPGNFNTTLGVVRTIREQLQPHHQIFIVEMGAKQPGDIMAICDLVHPSMGIVTAIGDMHLETFGSRENIQKTKFELIEALPADGLGIINVESPGVVSYGAVPQHCRVEAYGIDAHRADWRAANIVYAPAGTEFDLIGRDFSGHFSTRLLGEGNILDLCGAIIAAVNVGMDEHKIKLAVSRIQPVEHRLSTIRRGGLTILDDAYNSNPEGARMALDVMSRMQLPEGGRKIVVTPGFVELGAKQADECHLLGERAARAADILIIVNRYNREAIFEGARKSMPEESIILCDNLAEAAAKIQAVARPGDAVLYENDLPDTFK